MNITRTLFRINRKLTDAVWPLLQENELTPAEWRTLSTICELVDAPHSQLSSNVDFIPDHLDQEILALVRKRLIVERKGESDTFYRCSEAGFLLHSRVQKKIVERHAAVNQLAVLATENRIIDDLRLLEIAIDDEAKILKR